MLDKNKPIIALTGATGFLGSHLMASLLSSGYKIIVLGRPTKEETLQKRISKLLRWFSIEELADQLELVEIDFSERNLGIPEAKYKKLCENTEQIIHCASDTSFAEHKRDIVFKSNVNNLDGILKFAANASVNFFHYISTAYVAGISDGICKECISATSYFTNVYEESKAQAEKIIAEFCENNSIPITIIRPPIVYGDSNTGRSLKFNALYYPLRSLQNIKEIYLNDIKNHGGIKSQKNGIFIDNEGFLFLPLKIYLPKEGALNLIPVNYFVNATMNIIENSKPDGIYNLTNNAPTKMETVIVYNEQLMKIKGVEIVYGKHENIETRNPAEELFDRFIKPYMPYMADNRIFDRVNTDEVTGNLHPPEFTDEIFKNCMEYAIRVNWGESIFAEVNQKS
ncbi:MAG: SDR family oxidoreductase [Bacteroidota bacterium]